MTPRDFGPPTFAPRERFAALARERASGSPSCSAPSASACANDDVYRCHACLSIPTDPRYGSLNLAQAVQLIAYDWRQALGGFAVEPRRRRRRPGRCAPRCAGCSRTGSEALVAIGFLDPAAPKKLMPRLQPAVQPRRS